MTKKYKIVRFYKDRPGYTKTIKKGLTLEQARAHCRDPKTSSSYTNKDGAEAPGQWFDGYDDE
jgi:hypothetical protein